MAMALEGNGSNQDGFFEANRSRSSEGSASPPLEGRHQASCEDTASKTIDFLRARLLAERATSKAAKDCAEQNAKRVLELESMLEIEVELKKKAEAAMQKLMAQLREADHSVGSSRLSPDQTKLEKEIKTEDRVHVEDVASPNATCIAGIAEAEVENPSLNDILQDENSSSNSIQSQSMEQRREVSVDLNTDGVTLDKYQQNTGSVMEEGQLSNQNKVENDEGWKGSNDLNTEGAALDKYQQNTDSVMEEGQQSNQNKVENDEGWKGSNDLNTDGATFDEYQQNTGSIVEGVQSLVWNKVDNDEGKGGSNDLNTDCTTVDEYQQNTGCIEEEGRLSNQNKVDNDNNAILSNLIPLLQEENSSSADHGESLEQDKESAKEGYASQNYATSENLIDAVLAVNPRTRVEENLKELCNQMHKEVAALESHKQNEFVRWKLHEMVDQIVGTTDEQLHKQKAATLQVSSQCSKSSVLGSTDVQQNISGNNIGGSRLQMELPNGRQHIMDDMGANISFDSNTACDYRHHTERAAAACENLYSLQCSDCSDAFLTGKEVPCARELLENRKHVCFVQKQMSNVQSGLGNTKTDVNQQCRSIPESCCDDCFKELHLETKCLVCKTVPHSRSYCNNEKTVQVERNCSHDQAAISMELGTCWDLSRSSRSEGFKPRHCGFLNTNYLIQNSDTRVYERRGIVPGRSFCPEERPAPLRSFHDCLPMQCGEGPSYVSDSYGNARNMKGYSEHRSVPLISMQWGSRGTPFNSEGFPRSQMGKSGDVLIALRHAKEQIRAAIDKTQHSNV